MDGIAWVCHRYALFVMCKTPMHRFVELGWNNLGGNNSSDGWMFAAAIPRENLQKSITKGLADAKMLDFFREWEEYKKKPK